MTPEISGPPPNGTGLYVHIPFCAVKCRFCDFAAFPGRRREIPRYLAALARDLSSFRGETLETLFFGGGTPSLLESGHWRSLFESLRENFILTPDGEISVECNPESAPAEKLDVLRELGVNRLSFGLQSADDRQLKALGRRHDFKGFQRAYRSARSAGFSNLNVDLMYGLPGQSLDDWRRTLEDVLVLGPEHLSAYALSIEEKTAFGRGKTETDPDLQADMYEAASAVLGKAGFVHYEISNFARPGLECRHNLRYWRNQDCLGAGVSAAWYRGGVRHKNTENLSDYLDALESGRSLLAETASLTEEERLGENLMLGLRLKEGVSPSDQARALYGRVLDRFQTLGFLERTGSMTRPTLRGWRLSNLMFQELLSPQ